MREADFWITRMLTREPKRDLAELLKKRSLPPASLLSPEYDPSYVEWFIASSRSLWQVPDDKIKFDHRIYEIKFARSARYYVAVAASPRLEQWAVSRPGAPVYLISTGDPSARVSILSNYSTLLLETGKHALQYVWSPQFKDIDADGVPEIFIRYNLTWGQGFRQYLNIYKINNDIKLELFKKFEGQNEGMARVLGDGQIEVASGFPSQPALPPMSYDLWKVETWKYANKVYEKIGEKTMPHPLKSKEWEKFV